MAVDTTDAGYEQFNADGFVDLSLLSEEESLLQKSDNTRLKVHGTSISDLVNLNIGFWPFACCSM